MPEQRVINRALVAAVQQALQEVRGLKRRTGDPITFEADFAREQEAASERLGLALYRLNKFTLDGIVPDDLEAAEKSFAAGD